MKDDITQGTVPEATLKTFYSYAFKQLEKLEQGGKLEFGAVKQESTKTEFVQGSSKISERKEMSMKKRAVKMEDVIFLSDE